MKLIASFVFTIKSISRSYSYR